MDIINTCHCSLNSASGYINLAEFLVHDRLVVEAGKLVLLLSWSSRGPHRPTRHRPEQRVWPLQALLPAAPGPVTVAPLPGAAGRASPARSSRAGHRRAPALSSGSGRRARPCLWQQGSMGNTVGREQRDVSGSVRPLSLWSRVISSLHIKSDRCPHIFDGVH